MAELKKNAIKKAIRSIEKSYDYHSHNGKYDVLVDLDELVDLIANMSIPTTTEAEIRARAIEDFLVKLSDAYSEHSTIIQLNGVDFDILTVDGATEITWEVAEQLKEE